MILGRTPFQHVSYSTMKTPFVGNSAGSIESIAVAIRSDDFL